MIKIAKPFFVVALLACCCVNINAKEPNPPNIVCILADDLGINDVAAFAGHLT